MVRDNSAGKNVIPIRTASKSLQIVCLCTLLLPRKAGRKSRTAGRKPRKTWNCP